MSEESSINEEKVIEGIRNKSTRKAFIDEKVGDHREVNVRMLRADWIFQKRDKREKLSMIGRCRGAKS